MGKPFAGDEKKGASVLWIYERMMINHIAPKVPLWIKSYYLTLASIPISALIVFFGYLASYNIHWLWMSSLMIVLQYFTDSLDGELGKRRKMGMKRWGYFMDHFLDYIFLSAIIYGYSFLLPNRVQWMIIIVVILCTAFMVNSYLLMAATNEFKISFMGVGPTEGRIVAIFNNMLMIALGPRYVLPLLPYLLVIGFLALIYVVFRTQRHILRLDRLSKEP